jgi:hypothetical protein
MQHNDRASRFWANVEVGNTDDCWPWKGALNKDGKGQFRDGSKAKLAHRVAWELTHGELAPGQTITQECDTLGCVNPAHYRLGHKRGGKPPVRSKTTAEDVRYLRQQWMDGTLDREAEAKRLDVKINTLDYIVYNYSWKKGPHPPGYLDMLADRRRNKVTPELTRKINTLRDKGLSERAIAGEVGLPHSTVHDVLARS